MPSPKSLSNPQLVVKIRQLSHEFVVYKLKNAGRESFHLRADLDAHLAEASRRHIVILPPEMVEGAEDDSQGTE